MKVSLKIEGDYVGNKRKGSYVVMDRELETKNQVRVFEKKVIKAINREFPFKKDK